VRPQAPRPKRLATGEIQVPHPFRHSFVH
jgi:hypothetical protein